MSQSHTQASKTHKNQKHVCIHNHAHGARDILAEAVRFCEERGLRLTDQRRLVLELLAQSEKPLGAYELLEQLGSTSRKRLAPVTVYRALDFLLEAGLIHRLESRNAFFICPHRHSGSDAVVFLICEACGRVDEATSDAVQSSLGELALERGFQLQTRVIEMAGTCGQCQQAAGSPQEHQHEQAR